VRYTLRPGDLTGRPRARACWPAAAPEIPVPERAADRQALRPRDYRPEPIPEGTEPATGLIVDFVEALAAVQDHTTAQLLVPDMAKLTHGEARRILHAAERIRGAAISAPWEGFTVHLRPGANPPSEDIFSGLLYQELSTSAGTTEVTLGYRQVYQPPARNRAA
jgi:hypothetical protein